MMIRALADDGVTVIFSTHVIHHAERLCEGVAIIAGGKVPYAGSVEAARDRIPAQVRLETRARDARGCRSCRLRPAAMVTSSTSPCPKAGSSRC